MKLSANEEGALVLKEIPPFLLDLLQSVPRCASSSDPRVERRFFPAPSEDDLLVEDWKSLVHPGLEETFLAAREVVLSDLRGISEMEGEFAMEIPQNHLDAWLNTLNQARFAIAEENRFQERDLAEEVAPNPSDPRSIALFQISFYGFLQECLVKMQE